MFDNPFSMVVGICLIFAIAGVMRARYNAQVGVASDEDGNPVMLADPDAKELRKEVTSLKKRIAVLERIATDKSNRLEQEIEALRDDS